MKITFDLNITRDTDPWKDKYLSQKTSIYLKGNTVRI